MTSYDAVFLGGGLASSMAARYLKRCDSKRRILVLEKATEARWNPGESTVGVTGLFLIRDLGLSTYSYLHQLPKNGLRFFFNAKQETFEISRCSEIGSNVLPVFPTFQIDRKRITEDLWRLNAELGIEVRLGAAVSSLDLAGSSRGPHRLTFEAGGRAVEVETRWLVNGAGRFSHAAPVFNSLSPLIEDPDHRLAGAWGRFSNIVDIDALGDDAWRRRVGYTSRYLSTNHFMGRGYWIWAIPIDRGIVSFGVVYDKEVVKEDLTKNEAFRAFMAAHPISRALLEGARQEDFQSYPHLPFKRRRFCSPERWAFVGDAFMFVDPFYSPGSDVISRESYLLDHLLRAPDRELPAVTALLNDYCDLEYEILKLLYVHQYEGFGSFEVYNIKSLWDFHAYTNRVVWPFFSRFHRDLGWLKTQLASAPSTLALLRAMQKGFIDLRRHLDEKGLYERRNLEEYSLRQNRFRIEEQMLRGYGEEQSKEQHLHLCRHTVGELVAARFSLPEFGGKRVVQDALSFEIMAGFELSEGWLAGFLERVGALLSERVRQEAGERVDARLCRDCFSRPLPRGFEGSAPHVQAAASRLWLELARNVVAESLLR